MKKNFLFIMLAVFLAGFGFGGISMAQEATCTDGSTSNEGGACVAEKTTCNDAKLYYTSLSAAISAVQGDCGNGIETVTLLKDETGSFSTDKTFTLDLGGKTLTVNADEGVKTTTNGDLTITNGKIISTTNGDIISANGGKITLGNGLTVTINSSIVYSYNGGTVTVDGAILSSSSSPYTLVYVTGNGSKFIINSGKIDGKIGNHATLSVDGAGAIAEINGGEVYSQGSSTVVAKNGGKITITDGKISTDANFGTVLSNGNLSLVEIKGGEIKGDNTWAVVYAHGNGGKVEISGGKIYGAVTAHESSSNISEVIINDGAYIEGHENNWGLYAGSDSGKGKVTVNGGTIKGFVGSHTSNGTSVIVGGKFTKDVTQYTAEGYYSVYDGEEYYEVTNEIGTPTSFYMSSNFSDAEFKVILNEAGDSIDLWKTKAYLEKTLTAEQKTASTLYQLLKTAITTDGIEVLEAAGEKLLFINNTKESRTDVFRSSTSGKFNGDAFLPSKATSEGLDSLVYGEAIKPTWVTNVIPDKYNEIKDGETVIGYTLHISDGGWFYAPKAYTITFVDEDGTTVLHTQVVALGTTPVFDGTTPTKAADSSYTYSFKEWTPSLAEVTADTTYTASYTATKKPVSYSGGGGSSRSSSTTTTKTDDTKKTEDTSKTDETKTDESKTEENKVDGNNNDSVAPATFSQEFQDAYEFAYKNGITTMDSIEKADMYGPLTRVAMAKMLSQYAINVLGKEPDTTKVVPTFSDVDAKLDADYNNGITLAYQLGIMGIGINKYRPFDLVTRAEFGTALSRMLFGLEDGEGNEWYSTHLAKLMEEKIITNDTPNLQELRGYVMIMLMRSAQ